LLFISININLLKFYYCSIGEVPGNFDLVVVNDELDAAYAKLRSFLLPQIEALKSGER
jgi:hypothetical protein